jgi:hypothetical protein
MRRIRRLAAAFLAVFALGIAVAPSALAVPDCRPGQHGNPNPGFKPGTCK